MVQCQYITEAMIEYMEKSLQQIDCHSDVFSPFHAIKSPKEISDPMKKQLALDTEQNQDSDPAWKDHSPAAKHCRIDEDKMQIESKIAPHLVDESDSNFVKMYLLNHLPDHICQHGNL